MPELRELVLVGAGHAHVQVLRSFVMKRPERTRVTLVVDLPVAVYSGMVPGLVSGRYRPEELQIDAVPLARRAGARVVLTPATGIDPAARRIHLQGRPAIPYDLASFDIGSTVAGLDLPGVRERAFATRPIGRFVERVAEIELRARQTEGPFHLVVAGGGAGGVELAAAFRARLASASPVSPISPAPSVTLVHESPTLLPGSSSGVVRRVERALDRRGIRRMQGRVVAAEDERVVLADGSALPCSALVWATGAAAQPLFRSPAGAFALDERGFVKVRSTLEIVGHEGLFAVGDCATLEEYPATPKAGVYAVRQGPVLTRNLRACLEGRALVPYRPQRDFLTLLNLGDGDAVGAKWGAPFEGRWAMEWKDRIDRRFMGRFQLLDLDGAPGPAARALPEMGGGDEMEMACGGCAAKLGQDSLRRALARVEADVPAGAAAAPRAPEVVLGLREADDVAAYRVPGGDLMVVSVDFFRAFTDDPFVVGEVAARNAVSDLEAKGVAARWAQALVALPLAEEPTMAEETLVQVLAGARSVFDPLGVRLVGGHTSRATELQVGFSVQGVVAGSEEPAFLLQGGALRPGAALILTRPLGTGVLLHADMAGRSRGVWLASALAAMRSGNREAGRLARAAGALAATDVTGFGLAGHLVSLLGVSGLSARLELGRIPALPGALELLARGERSTFHPENERLLRALALPQALALHPRLPLLFDPQTAGGLLLAVPGERAETLLADLMAAGYPEAARIGEVRERSPDGALFEVAP